MEGEVVKRNFVGFAHVVTPLQKAFHAECSEADLDTDVLQFFSELQSELIGGMMSGASTLAKNRKSEDVAVEDLLCHLDMQWKVDPLLLSQSSYQVAEFTKKTDVAEVTQTSVTRTATPTERTIITNNINDKFCGKVSLPTTPPPRQRRAKRCSKIKKTAPKVKKNSVKRSKEMKREADKRMYDICRFVLFKTPLPEMKKKSEAELKVERQPSVDMSCPDLVDIFGNKKKKKGDRFDDISESTPVTPMHNSLSKLEKKDSKKSDSELLAKRQPSTMSRPDVIEIFGNKQKKKVYEFDGISEASPTASPFKSNSKVEEKISFSDYLIKDIPSKEKTEEFKVPNEANYNLFIADAASGFYPEAPTHKLKSKDEDKILISDKSTKVPCTEKPLPKSKFTKQTSVSSHTSSLFTHSSGINLKQEVSDDDTVFKQSSEALIGKPKSKVEEKPPISEHSIKVLPSKEKSKIELEVVKQPSIGMPVSYSQIFKILENKGKGSCKHTSIETSKVKNQPCIEILHPNSQVPKIPGKSCKQKELGIKEVPIESPETTRKKLASTLLRIAGK